MKKKNNKPYKYSSRDRLTNTSSFPFKVSDVKETKKNLENTLTKLRIIEEVPKEEETLDNSFLEGRFDNKDKKKSAEKKHKNSSDKMKMISFFRQLFLSVSGVCAVLLIVLCISNFMIHNYSDWFSSQKETVEVSHKNSAKPIDDNYLFVGDFHTSELPFQEYGFDYHYVNVGERSFTTNDLLGNMKKKIYNYNPSIIFLEVGMIDIEKNVSKEVFLDHYTRILNLIQMNRPYAEVYVESIYPINRDVKRNSERLLGDKVNNSKINDYNVSLKELCKEKGVHYLDFNAVLSKDNQLNSLYTDDGIYLNQEGYKEVINIIKSVI